jgi:hypothetical protein
MSSLWQAIRSLWLGEAQPAQFMPGLDLAPLRAEPPDVAIQRANEVLAGKPTPTSR